MKDEFRSHLVRLIDADGEPSTLVANGPVSGWDDRFVFFADGTQVAIGRVISISPMNDVDDSTYSYASGGVVTTFNFTGIDSEELAAKVMEDCDKKKCCGGGCGGRV